MLPQNLLRARRRRGTIRPLYAKDDELSLSKTLISVFEAHVDKQRGELRTALSRCEELGYNYKLVRGMAAILEDSCIFQTRDFVNPAAARRAVFEEAGERVVATAEERRRILSAAAFRLGVSADDLDTSLYADLWDEHVLADFQSPMPQELLKEYNFALTLALLSQARGVELTYRGVDTDLERLGEKLGRSEAHSAGGLSRHTVELRPSSRAGQQAVFLEELLARLMLHEGWRLTAEVPHSSRTGKKYLFELNWESDAGIITPSNLKQRISDRSQARGKQRRNLPDEIVIVDELASKLGVTEAEARRRLQDAGGSYVDLGGVLVTPGKLKELEKAMSGAPDMRLGTVRGILRRLGLRRPLPVLEALGYAVDWAEDRDQSRVYRLRQRRSTA